VARHGHDRAAILKRGRPWRNIPRLVLDASRLDGCGFFRQWWHVAVPTARPGLAFLAIYTFVASWNDLLGVIASKGSSLARAS